LAQLNQGALLKLMIHYHGTPITPYTALYELAGRHFCVSHARGEQVRVAHEIGQSVMLDNGAFSKWKRGKATDWAAYYEWCERWLDVPDDMGRDPRRDRRRVAGARRAY
jgi:hypothetical protein